jgi:hypothetical protein
MVSIRSTKADVIFDHVIETLDDELGLFIDQINKEVQGATPVRTGTAQRGWRIVNNFDASLSVYNRFGGKSLIENKVPYIGLLDIDFKTII